jgi:hypothetical protein
MRKDEIVVKNQEGKILHDVKLKFVSRINNAGDVMLPMDKEPVVIGRTEFVIHCLSISNKKWIATDGMSTYIVELVDVPKPQLTESVNVLADFLLWYKSKIHETDFSECKNSYIAEEYIKYLKGNLVSEREFLRTTRVDTGRAVEKLFSDDKFIANVCCSFRHDFGMMAEQDKQRLIFDCKEWMRAITNNMI